MTLKLTLQEFEEILEFLGYGPEGCEMLYDALSALDNGPVSIELSGFISDNIGIVDNEESEV